MPDFKILRRSSSFSVMNNDIFYDLDLSHSAMGLLCKMLSLPPEWDYTVKGLVAISKDGRTAIRRQLKELETAGYLSRTQTRDSAGRMSKTLYIVRDYRQKQEYLQELTSEKLQKEPWSDFPTTENPTSENPTSEKRPQLNTNELNTNELNTNSSSLSNEKENFIEKFKTLFKRVPDKSLLRIIGKAMPEDVETALNIAAKKKLYNPAAYITTILKKIQQKRQDEAIRLSRITTDLPSPLEDWEKQWLAEVKQRIAEREKEKRERKYIAALSTQTP